MLCGAILGTAAAICGSGIAMAAIYLAVARELPASQALDISRLSQSTKIFDRNGDLLYEVFDPRGGKRTVVQAGQISSYLKQAIIATEDPTFYDNWGVDWYAILRASYYNLLSGDVVAGGSTITQQLVKNQFLSTEPTFERKIREAILAVELTRRYPKEQILGVYLNAIYFGNLAYGVQAAAQNYFGKDAFQLDLAEASLLAGLPQAPARYDPCMDADAALARQRIVLGLMVKAGYIDGPQAMTAAGDMARRLRSPEFETRCARRSDLGTTFRAPHFVNFVRARLEEHFGPEVLYNGGLQVTTTLDPAVQAIAEDEAGKQIDALRDKHVTNAAVVVMHPATGEIYAMVGSVDFANQEIAGQVNVADRLRQPGSAIKPINYVTAFGRGWTPATPIYDLKTTFPTGGDPTYTPVNYDRREHGLISARVALASSFNIPAVKTLYFTSSKEPDDGPRPAAMIDTARRLGITTFTDNQGRPVQPFGLALTLGGGDVKLVELTGAFAVFANLGARVPPTPYLKIIDGRGRVVYDGNGKDKPKPRCAQFDPSTPNEQPDASGFCAKSAPFAYLITDILSDNNARSMGFGLNSVLRLSRPAAAKTGTTDDFRDNWTLGYTPEIVVGVWVGNADNTPMRNVSGVTGAAPIWHNIMERVLQDRPPQEFPVPPGIVPLEVCVDSGLPPTELCPRDHRRVELFVAGHEPKRGDGVFQRLSICGSEAIYQVPPHDVGDLIPYDRIVQWARSQGWNTPPQGDVACGPKAEPRKDIRRDDDKRDNRGRGGGRGRGR